ncbi:hypothetical protein ACLESO_15695 [Pyxidicoccus sp. 3LG]
MGKRTKRGEPKAPEYDASSIKVLAYGEAVRRRPWMYLGPERRQAVLVAPAALEPFFAKGARCTRMEVTWTSEGVVQFLDDDWSVDTEPDARGKPSIESVLTSLFGPGSGRRGDDLRLVTLMSEWLILEVHQPARLYRQRFEVGEARPPETGVATPPWRTLITFKPDARCVDASTPLTADALIQECHRRLDLWRTHSRDPEWPDLAFEPSDSKVVITRSSSR